MLLALKILNYEPRMNFNRIPRIRTIVSFLLHSFPGWTAINASLACASSKRFAAALVLVFVWSPLFAKVKRHDVVIMKGGDRITGEVKKLQNGILYIQTDYISGSVGVDWLQVESVQSTATFQVVLDNGDRVIGLIEKVPGQDTQGQDFTIRELQGEQHAEAHDVVDIEIQKSSFWRQLTGSFDIGYSLTSGNGQQQENANANIKYLTRRWATEAGIDSSFSGQTGADKTNTQQGQFAFDLFLNHNSFLLALAEFLHSSQQDLELRSTFGGAFGRYLVRGNRSNLRWLAGGVYTHEKFDLALSRPVQGNIEGLVGAQYSWFSFDRTQLQSQVMIFPGLTDLGRVRATTNSNLTIKLPNNFHLSLSMWDNFDSKPPGAAKKNELGISTGFGYSF